MKQSYQDERDISGMIGKYVIARGRGPGVHAGVLRARNGQECLLSEGRRLWYWVAKRSDFLSGVAVYGISEKSKVGAPVETFLLEICEILLCTEKAENSIRGAKEYEPE